MRPGPLALAVVLAACAAPDPTLDAASVPDPAPTTAPATTVPTSSTIVARPSTTSAPTSTTTIPTTTSLAPLQGLALETVAEGLSQPLLLVSPPGDERSFVVERTGRILILGREEPFLDLTDRVDSNGIEQGLLGLAFHPDYASNGRFFVFYFRKGASQTRVSELRVSDLPDRADPDSERPLLTFDKPTTRHNGGMLEFGPDGMLWISVGEGGAASIHSQDPNTLLSALLRIDVDRGDPYAVPPDNPFVEGGGAPEVWAYGLRNPWRFTIDRGLVYIADVGHERWEEIDVAPLDTGGGSNFGWIRMEGAHCFQGGCDPETEDLVLPVLEYSHDEGCSVTGGYVYRGKAIPELDGHYLYSDWCGEWVRSFRYTGGRAVEQAEWLTGAGQVNGFGRDAAGELYVLTWDGTVKRIVAVR